MPKISEQRREQRRREIMDAALRCFARSGYRGTSMSDIIDESGLSAGAIYGYFASKQELIRSVASGLLTDRRIELLSADAVDALSPAAVVATLIEGMRAHVPTRVLLQVWGEASTDPDLRAMVQGFFGELRMTVVESLQRWARAHPETIDGDPLEWATNAAPVLLGLVPGFILQHAVIEDFDEEGYLRALPGALLG